ncbi:neurotensin receptor type 1-like [Daphnia pulex]|uniref:neurotensin receptor type 1-like n=1 Tax=Daphnia pulex TaxID=6669 RepID=UPI001EDD97CE|nr:neurotensin receptor type 1-like [Daphnia pulex]XP_046440101.1 neurotensin receptor type 1-like [Daphnia pulex]
MAFDAGDNSSTDWLLPDVSPLDSNASYLMNGSYGEWNVDTYLATHWGPKHLPMDVVVPITIVYILIFVSGVVGNIAVCVVIVRNPSMHTATNCYLFSLAVSDLTVLLFGLPNDLSVYWQQYPWALGEIVCKLRALIAEMTNYASVLTIVAFSLERYLAICHPLHAYTMAGLGRAARIVALIWLVALISALPFAIYTGISYVPYPAEAGVSPAGVNLTGQAIPESAFCILQDENPPNLFEVATFIFFIVPMGILCLLYLRIGIRIRRTSLGRGRNVQGVVHHSNESRQSSSRRTILRMLVAVVIAFFICWAPFHAQRLLYVYAKDSPNYREINEKMFFVTGCFYFFSSTINPILYNVMSVRYREAFRETLCGGIPASSRHHYNHQRYASDRFSANSRNGGSVNNTSGTWLSTAERRSLRRPSPTANGAVKETLIPEEMTTNVDTELLDGGSSKKMMPALGNPALRIGFVHQEEVGLSGFPVVSTASNVAGALVGQQQQPCSPDGVLYHRPAKPVEWRVHLASVKPKTSNGGAASLPAGCTPLCLKSSQLVRTASETNRKEPHTTPGVVSAEYQQQQHQLSLAASKPTAGDVAGDGQQHQLPDFGLSALVEPEVISTNHHQDPVSSATVRDTSIQNAGRLS